MPNKPAVDYTAKDYDGFKDSLIASIPDFLPEWTSRSESDFGIVLIELFSYLADILSFYGDRIANEAFLATAVQRSSVIRIAKMLDYRPTGPNPASVDVTFTTAPGSGSTTIPAGTRVGTVASAKTPAVVFETTAPLTILGTDAATPVYSGSVIVSHGETVNSELIGTSTGALSQPFTLFYNSVIEPTIQVSVDEGSGPTIWAFVENLIDAGPNDINYTTFTDENGVVSVIFGDNVNGRVPVTGSVIRATYRRGGGTVGNVGAGSITDVLDPVLNVTSSTNVFNASGGADPESINHIKKLAPLSFATMRRAVTLNDYAALALHVPGVQLAIANATVYTNVTLGIAPFGGGLPSTTLKNAVLAYLADKKQINTSVSITDPVYVGVNITTNINVLPQYNQQLVTTAVTNALRTLLAFENVDFGFRISLSAVYRAITGVEGVDYATVTVLSLTSGLGDVTPSVFQIPQVGGLAVNATGGLQ